MAPTDPSTPKPFSRQAAAALSAPPSTVEVGPLSYALVKLAKVHKAAMATRLRHLGLYPGQELLLMRLWDAPEQTQGELVSALTLDASTVARMVSRLEQQGFISRRTSETDHRAVIVSLTERGAALKEPVRKLWRELEELTTAGLTPEAQQALLQTLRELTKNFTD